MEPASYQAAIGESIVVFVGSGVVDQAVGQGTVCLIVIKLALVTPAA